MVGDWVKIAQQPAAAPAARCARPFPGPWRPHAFEGTSGSSADIRRSTSARKRAELQRARARGVARQSEHPLTIELPNYGSSGQRTRPTRVEAAAWFVNRPHLRPTPFRGVGTRSASASTTARGGAEPTTELIQIEFRPKGSQGKLLEIRICDW